jgi:uncharacterized protein (TIGR02996 family)
MTRSHADAFLDDILQSPDDDTPRLVFADWLEEHGGPAGLPRAEFIRLQCRLAAGGLPAVVRTRLEARQRQLLLQHAEAWARPVRSLVRNYAFRRGFVAEVWLTARGLLAWGHRLCRRTPIQHLHLSRVRSPGTDQTSLCPALADCPELARLASLDLGHNGLTSEDLQALLVSKHLGRLEALDLYANRIGDAGLRALALSPLLGQLHTVNLDGNDFGPPGLRALGEAVQRLAAAEGLRLRQVYLGSSGGPAWVRQALASFPPLRRVARWHKLRGPVGRRRPAG